MPLELIVDEPRASVPAELAADVVQAQAARLVVRSGRV